MKKTTNACKVIFTDSQLHYKPVIFKSDWISRGFIGLSWRWR